MIKILLKKEDKPFNATTELTFDVTENGTSIRRFNNMDDGREYDSIEKYDTSWKENIVRDFFITKVNVLIEDGYRVEDIQQ